MVEILLVRLFGLLRLQHVQLPCGQVYVIRHGLGQQVCRLLSAPQKYLQLAAVRVLRAIIGTKEPPRVGKGKALDPADATGSATHFFCGMGVQDEAYVRYVSKNNLLTLLLQSGEPRDGKCRDLGPSSPWPPG